MAALRSAHDSTLAEANEMRQQLGGMEQEVSELRQQLEAARQAEGARQQGNDLEVQQLRDLVRVRCRAAGAQVHGRPAYLPICMPTYPSY
jgi:TolA-binding protein